MSIKSVAEFTHLKANVLNDYYKNHLSGFHSWNQKKHSEEFTLYACNLGEHLAIDESSLINGELYTIVKSVTMDMSNSMYKIVRKCFPNAEQIVDRFHVQKLMYDALQDLRIKHRWEVMAEDNRMRALYKEKGLEYKPEILSCGDTLKQLMVRCSRLLVRKPNDWTESQAERAKVLFCRFPDMKEFYYLALRLGKIYSDYDNKDVARPKLALWFNQVEQWNCEEFNTVIKTFQNHYDRILNFFNDKRTNASAESFNCKLKTFRAEFRGVNDLKFYLYRVKQLFV